MRPMLKPALVRVWRDPSTMQFGADPSRAIVMAGISVAVRRVLELLDGTRDRPAVVAAAEAAGVDPALTDEVLRRLQSAGLLDDATDGAGALRAIDPPVRERLGPELAALSLLRPAPGEALDVIARRQRQQVVLLGPRAITGQIEELLRCAGVGELRTLGGPAPAFPDPRRPAELVVICGYHALAPEVADVAARLAAGHLAVVIRDVTGVVGPLVRPGETSCLRCHDLHRCDRDPAWPLLSLQLASRRTPVPACPAALLAIVAGTAALQALEHLDGGRPATVDGTVELALPDWRLRRRSWSPHPDCTCGLARAG